MIAKGSTSTVNFYAVNTDGTPAVGKTITATISINGAAAVAITDTIVEKGSGWYRFDHTFNTDGNAFIEFSCTGCIIPPWEDEVVEISSSAPSANDVARAVWSDTASYPIFQGQYPKGYYQANPPVVNVWGQTAYAGQSITYGDLMKSTAKSSELTGLSTFNAATDTVTINATQAATMVTATGFATPSDIPSSDITSIKTKVDSLHNTDLSGIATTTNVSDAQSAIIAAMPDVSNLSTFDPATDQVSVSTFSASFIANQVWDGKEAYATPMDVSDAIRTINVSLGLLEDHGDTNWSTANISGLSTFNPSTDRVLIDATQAAGMVTATGFATPANITTAQKAIIAAIPTVPTDYAKVTDIPDISGLATSTALADVATTTNAIGEGVNTLATGLENLARYGNEHWSTADVSGLSTFNPATDTVQLDSTQLTSLATGSEITDAKNDILTALADIDIDTSELAKATDVAVIADMLKQLDSGVLHWSTTATTLTLFNDDNTVMKTYSLQRDIQGNIVRIDPINV